MGRQGDRMLPLHKNLLKFNNLWPWPRQSRPNTYSQQAKLRWQVIDVRIFFFALLVRCSGSTKLAQVCPASQETEVTAVGGMACNLAAC